MLRNLPDGVILCLGTKASAVGTGFGGSGYPRFGRRRWVSEALDGFDGGGFTAGGGGVFWRLLLASNRFCSSKFRRWRLEKCLSGAEGEYSGCRIWRLRRVMEVASVVVMLAFHQMYKIWAIGGGQP